MDALTLAAQAKLDVFPDFVPPSVTVQTEAPGLSAEQVERYVAITKEIKALEAEKALLAEAGYANGFETTISFDLGGATIGEPMTVLIQESLASIGIKAQINKIPGATWRAALWYISLSRSRA